ncbi:hypothetical protein [Brevibacillus dissolubilis]|uniref:hypothetical protein n=1 Tax=Brevibacillus dissolubilis TaxID=1844116 RepID=UPI001116E45E|nr:hypothetical protein [Brevibacillus dissolubilis]
MDIQGVVCIFIRCAVTCCWLFAAVKQGSLVAYRDGDGDSALLILSGISHICDEARGIAVQQHEASDEKTGDPEGHQQGT